MVADAGGWRVRGLPGLNSETLSHGTKSSKSKRAGEWLSSGDLLHRARTLGSSPATTAKKNSSSTEK
jgi:hypothetical protein